MFQFISLEFTSYFILFSFHTWKRCLLLSLDNLTPSPCHLLPAASFPLLSVFYNVCSSERSKRRAGRQLGSAIHKPTVTHYHAAAAASRGGGNVEYSSENRGELESSGTRAAPVTRETWEFDCVCGIKKKNHIDELPFSICKECKVMYTLLTYHLSYRFDWLTLLYSCGSILLNCLWNIFN